MMTRLSALTLVFVLALSAPALAGFEEGRAAYNKQQWKEAITHLRPAAEKDDPRAQILLGNMYADGYGVEKSEEEAFTLYYRAAVLGNTDGMVAVATLYQTGTGVARNDRMAIDWFERAARAGNQTGAFFYAIHLYQGRKGDTFDFKPDHKQAYKWFRIAALKNDVPNLEKAAVEIYTNIAQNLLPEEVSALDKEAFAFKPEDAASLGPVPEDRAPAATDAGEKDVDKKDAKPEDKTGDTPAAAEKP